MRCDDVSEDVLRRIRDAHDSMLLRRVTVDCRKVGFDQRVVDLVQQACAVHKIVLHL